MTTRPSVPPPPPSEPDPPSSATSRGAATRADHAAIERLVEALLPALAARLRVGDLDELEVREGGWRVRLRRPPGPMVTGAEPSGAADRPDRPERPGGRDRPERSDRPGAATAGRPSSRASGSVPGPRPVAPSLVGVGPATGGTDPDRGHHRGRPRRTVTAPAVGLVRPGDAFAVGRRVRAGDRLGTIDVLGVPHDVLAPSDGIVVEVAVEAGQPVEYGQELGVVEVLAAERSPTSGAVPEPAGDEQ